jgi:hypothetical protein
MIPTKTQQSGRSSRRTAKDMRLPRACKRLALATASVGYILSSAWALLVKYILLEASSTNTAVTVITQPIAVTVMGSEFMSNGSFIIQQKMNPHCRESLPLNIYNPSM